MRDKKIIIACIIIVICFIIIGVIGKNIADNMPEETQNVTITTETDESSL